MIFEGLLTLEHKKTFNRIAIERRCVIYAVVLEAVYFPLKTGFRFSLKANSASTRSSVGMVSS